MVKIAILCGGVGSRLWPLSRKEKPKQFMKLPGAQYNLFQETVMRINNLNIRCSELIIVSNVEIKDEITDCVNHLPIECPVTFIWEPTMRNTGPAIGSLINYLSMDNQSLENDNNCIVWPSDHLLCMDTFNKSIEIANRFIKDSIITFGICPTYPETGYGYVISTGDYKIEQFIEKPPLNIAEQLIKNLRCYWNSGMFYFNVNLMMNEYQQKDPLLMEIIQQSFGKLEKNGKLTNIHIDSQIYSQCCEIPFDKLIMERTDKGRVIPFNGTWSDIGSWDSISKLKMTGESTNVIQLDNQNCHIYNYHDKQIISAIGLKDICIINTTDALLISDLSQTQKVKNVYQQLENAHSSSVKRHVNNDYSWGLSEKLDSYESTSKIFKYTVNEKMSPPLKYQSHEIMYLLPITGNGVITIGTEEIIMEPHKQLHIPKNTSYTINNLSESDKLIFIAFQFD